MQISKSIAVQRVESTTVRKLDLVLLCNFCGRRDSSFCNLVSISHTTLFVANDLYLQSDSTVTNNTDIRHLHNSEADRTSSERLLLNDDRRTTKQSTGTLSTGT